MRHFLKRHLISRFCSNLEMTKVQRSTLNSWPGKTMRGKDLRFDTRIEHFILYLLRSGNEGSKTSSLWCNLWSKKTLHFQYLSFSWKRTYNPHIYITIIRFGLTFNFVSPISQEKKSVQIAENWHADSSWSHLDLTNFWVLAFHCDAILCAILWKDIW